MGTISQTHARAEASSQLYLVGGVGAFLYLVLSGVALAFTDWNNPATSGPITRIAGTLAAVSLLSVVYALYEHLRPASQPLSASAAVAGLLAVVGQTLGSIFGYESTIGMVSGISASFGALVWLGLGGYLSLSSRLLPSPWALLTMAQALIVAAAAVMSIVGDPSSPEVGIAWTIVNLVFLVWALWTGIEFVRRARTTPVRA